MNQIIRYMLKLGHPAANKNAVWILILALLYRVIDADRIDTGNARLHLALAVMNAWFIVDKTAALNKWLKPRVPAGCVIHSFCHSLRDRLRAIEYPADIIDAIGGWTTEGVGINMVMDTRYRLNTDGWKR